MIETGISFLTYYLRYFGDNKFQFVDLVPTFEPDDRPHIGLDEKFTHPLPDQKNVEDFDKYTHPCWCNPELIYADDLRGNEVWHHKPSQ